MKDLIFAFLSRDWAGLVIGLSVGALGASCAWAGRAQHAKWAAGLSYLTLAIAAVLALGSIFHLGSMAHVRAQNPPPGVMVDVGGYRLHLLAEGEAHGKPAIVWIPGSHSAGFAFQHLHAMLRSEARSILIDRAGSGWSDIGPFPRTSAIEAREVIAALENAGERGPFVLVGHSLGGLLVANIARRRPELVAGLVLLDATPPDAINYSPPNPYLTNRSGAATLAALRRLFGLHPALASGGAQRDRDPAAARIGLLIEQRLGAALDQMNAIETGPRSVLAYASISAELSPGGPGWTTTVYDGDLGDMRVFLVAPRDMVEFESAFKMLAAASADAPEAIDKTRLLRFYSRSRERYMAASSRTERIYAPAGTGHNFPYEAPEFVADVVRRMLREQSQGPEVSE